MLLYISNCMQNSFHWPENDMSYTIHHSKHEGVISLSEFQLCVSFSVYHTLLHSWSIIYNPLEEIFSLTGIYW